jgi:hypothetical protein
MSGRNNLTHTSGIRGSPVAGQEERTRHALGGQCRQDFR